MNKNKSTMVELFQELEELAKTDSRLELKEMIAEAKAGEYHDFKNQKYVCGKVEAVTRLDKLGYVALAERVMQGEFDEEADAEDIAYLKATVAPAFWGPLGLEGK